jgi:hypothetical protein
MGLRKKVFTSQQISVFFGGKEFRIQALVSVYGVKYAFDDIELPEAARTYIGYEVQMSYKGVPGRCRIIRESNNAGTIYNLRFVNPSRTLTNMIERDIRESGLPSPWMRNLPRLTTDMKDLPAPALAVLNFRGEIHYLNVKNFTLGGLLLEFVGGMLHGVVSGTRFEFDLVTNAGEKLADVAGIVSHVSVEVNEQDGSLSHSYFGLKFLPMDVFNETKYRELIREHCLLLREAERAGHVRGVSY